MNIVKAFGHAFRGLKDALREEPNLRFHFLGMAIVVAMGFYFRISNGEWCVLTIVIGSVISLELVNTAIENLADLVSLEQHPAIRKIKDISAAAVLIAALVSTIVGAIIFSKYIF